MHKKCHNDTNLRAMDAADRIKVLEAENGELKRNLDLLIRAIEIVNEEATKQAITSLNVSTKIREALREIVTKENTDDALKRTYLMKCEQQAMSTMVSTIKCRANVASECIAHVTRGDLIILMLELTERQASYIRFMGFELSLDDDVITCQ